MRKFIIYLSVILLSYTVGFSQQQQSDSSGVAKQEKTSPPPADDKTDKGISDSKSKVVQTSQGNRKTEEKKQETKENPNTIDTALAKQESENLLNGTYKNRIEDLANRIDNLKEETNRLTWELEEERSLFSWNKILLIVSAVLVLALLVYIIIDRKNRKDEILYMLTGIDKNDEYGYEEDFRIKQWKDKIVGEAVNAAKENPSFNLLQRSINTLESDVKSLQSQTTNFKNYKPEQANEPPRLVFPKKLYADSIVEGMFNRISESSNEDTVYELLLEKQNDKTVTFTVFCNAYRRVVNTPDFVDGCDKQKINEHPTDLKVDRGEAHLQDNGKWKITKKAKVKFV